ncbi:phage shock protein C (PspC) family protein [Actinopolyspora mzabensis]|uniref:Phage shock protein C (PspC) family protein n=1 Tax=Actinopolyspora mzabensis TaxID=995066 RepID=A0A1G9C643_ACTMZ|nr:PspC domain-containing protein [Actinopolyspora mzabensis]SDK47139.1 phage shock protein C (PspC) family protein [Actinopolyspora mzabensis]
MTNQEQLGQSPTGTGERVTTGQPREHRFRRSREERMIAGVCGGAAELFGVDATIVRIVLVAATLVGFGTGLLIYLACWLIVPEA